MSVASQYKRLLYGHVAADYFSKEFKTESLPASDILLHLPVLEWYASQCNDVVEFGVRDGHSSLAFLSGLQKTNGVLYSYDLALCPLHSLLAQECLWYFEQLNSLSQQAVESVPQADLFFFDTLHTDTQIREELRLHAWKSRKYLVFHDTVTCGEYDRSGPVPSAKGIQAAIHDYTSRHGFGLVYENSCCNGLRVFARKSGNKD